MRLNRVTSNPNEYVSTIIGIALRKLQKHPSFSIVYDSLFYVPLIEADKISFYEGRVIYGGLLEEGDFKSFEDYNNFYIYVGPYYGELFDIIRLIAVGWLYIQAENKTFKAILAEEFEIIYEYVFEIPEIEASVIRQRNRKAAKAKSPTYYLAKEIYCDFIGNGKKITAKILLSEIEKKGHKPALTTVSKWLTEFKKVA